ncbi:phosphatidylethanolamine-binding protein [Apiospora saccharicola]
MMKLPGVYTLLVLAGLSAAQTPDGFTPSVTPHLDVIFGTKEVTPGLSLTKSDTARAPTIGLKTEPNGTYVWMMIDLDAKILMLFCHATQIDKPLQSQARKTGHLPSHGAEGLQGQRAEDGQRSLHAEHEGHRARGVVCESPSLPLICMLTPPAENPPHPHRYTHLLWTQPENWVISQAAQTQLQSGKTGFNVASFQKAAGLADPIAGNYFNQTG